MYTLYHYPYSQHARRVVSLLEEAGLDYQLEHVAMDKGDYLSDDYRQINPNCQVPTLIDGDIKIHESNAILRYLCFKHELNDWYPTDAKGRASVEQWLDWNQCRLAPAVVDIVLNKVFMGDKGDKAAIDRGETSLQELLPILDAGLADRDFLAGGKATIADLSVASNIFHLSIAEIKPNEKNIDRWFTRMMAISGFKKSLPEG
ncbi:MAG: glutathione S-transferase family protein [Thiohalomonadales bacterium]